MQLGMPDAALPEGGLELRALVEPSIDGATEVINWCPARIRRPLENRYNFS